MQAVGSFVLAADSLELLAGSFVQAADKLVFVPVSVGC